MAGIRSTPHQPLRHLLCRPAHDAPDEIEGLPGNRLCWWCTRTGVAAALWLSVWLWRGPSVGPRPLGLSAAEQRPAALQGLLHQVLVVASFAIVEQAEWVPSRQEVPLLELLQQRPSLQLALGWVEPLHGLAARWSVLQSPPLSAARSLRWLPQTRLGSLVGLVQTAPQALLGSLVWLAGSLLAQWSQVALGRLMWLLRIVVSQESAEVAPRSPLQLVRVVVSQEPSEVGLG